jgi:Tfp pilus assembly protein PilF
MGPDPELLAEKPRANLARRLVHRLWGAIRQRPRTSIAGGVLLLAAVIGAGVFAWTDYQFRAAERSLLDEQYDEALRHVRLGLRVRSGSVEGHLLAARIERKGSNYAEAERELQECVRLQKGATATTQMEWLLLRAQRGEVDDVGAGLWYCVDHDDPEAGSILEAMARSYMHQYRLGPALVCLDRWLEREADCVRALDWRGWVHERLQQRQAAREDYRRALELAPGRSEVRLRLAEMLLDDVKPDEAAQHYERLLRELPDRQEVLVGLARCSALKGNFSEAHRLIDDVLAAHPDDPDALLEQGRLDLEEGRPADAEVELKRSLAARPYYLPTHFSLLQSLQRQPGREAEAAEAKARHDALKADLDRLTVLLGQQGSKSRGNPERASEVGVLLLRTGQDQLGLDWLNMALKLDPRSASAHKALASYYEKKGESDKAEEHRRAAEEP